MEMSINNAQLLPFSWNVTINARSNLERLKKFFSHVVVDNGID